MTIDLNKDQKIKLKRLFEEKNYTKFESQIKKLGSIENLPVYLKMGYAGSKVLNPDSKKEEDNYHIDLMSQIASLALEEKVRGVWKNAKAKEEISRTFY